MLHKLTRKFKNQKYHLTFDIPCPLSSSYQWGVGTTLMHIIYTW